MNKIALGGLLLVLLLFSNFTRAQVIDKEKVMEYLQNQQFEDAITYLLPLYTKGSRNIQLLNYLGYASYMNEEKVNRTEIVYPFW